MFFTLQMQPSGSVCLSSVLIPLQYFCRLTVGSYNYRWYEVTWGVKWCVCTGRQVELLANIQWREGRVNMHSRNVQSRAGQ